jgi:hypothetical protein
MKKSKKITIDPGPIPITEGHLKDLFPTALNAGDFKEPERVVTKKAPKKSNLNIKPVKAERMPIPLSGKESELLTGIPESERENSGLPLQKKSVKAKKSKEILEDGSPTPMSAKHLRDLFPTAVNLPDEAEQVGKKMKVVYTKSKNQADTQ